MSSSSIVTAGAVHEQISFDITEEIRMITNQLIKKGFY